MEKSELVTFFENRGYENVKPVEHRSRNDIIHATKNGQKCFIKKFNPTPGADRSLDEKIHNESACYKNLPKNLLINVVEINIKDRYITLEHTEFDKFVEDKKYIEELADFQLELFPNLDAPYLSETTWDYYEEIFEKIKTLEKEGIIENANKIVQKFEDQRSLIMDAKKIFSQQDFNRSNIKKVNGQLKFFDFEEPRLDNAMVDMATMAIDILHLSELSDAYQKKVQTSKLYNEKLFNLMKIRRAAIVMYARLCARKNEIKDGEMPQFLQNNIDAFHQAVKKL